ncbi:hypothetical protein ABI59_05325 [Acidobacteria bacterium Mor1]|nr:hypothetical protein ABI59_05325 [Acidobacteria bacterium Mor1]
MDEPTKLCVAPIAILTIAAIAWWAKTILTQTEAPKSQNTPMTRNKDRHISPASLRQENARLRMEVAAQRATTDLSAKLAVLVTVGPSLVRAIENWIRVVQRDQRLPERETAEVLAGIVRRLVRVGIVAAAVGSAPLIVLGTQSCIMSQQVAIQRQVVAHDLVERYLADLADPQAPQFKRQRAFDGLLAIEKESRSEIVNLNEANLSGLNLRALGTFPKPVSLRGATLLLAQVVGVRVKEVDFEHAKLEGANFSDSTFYKCNFSDCDFLGVDLGNTRFSSTTLERANFSNSKWSGDEYTFLRPFVQYCPHCESVVWPSEFALDNPKHFTELREIPQLRHGGGI